jgi:hypothetical protein
MLVLRGRGAPRAAGRKGKGQEEDGPTCHRKHVGVDKGEQEPPTLLFFASPKKFLRSSFLLLYSTYFAGNDQRPTVQYSTGNLVVYPPTVQYSTVWIL